MLYASPSLLTSRSYTQGLTDASATRLEPAGMTRVVTDGGYGPKVFIYLKNEQGAATNNGEVLTPLIPSTKTGDADASPTYYQHLDGAKSWTVNEWQNSYISVIVTPGIGQTRFIKSNTATVCDLEPTTPWTTVLTTSSDYTLYNPYWIEAADGADEVVCAVGIGTVPADYWAWYQVGGIHDYIEYAGDTDAAVLGELLIAEGTEGVARGSTAAAVETIDASQGFGFPTMVHGTAATSYVAAMLNCRFYSIF